MVKLTFLIPEEMQKWLTEFPNSAMQGMGIGDLSIIHDFNRICCQNSGLTVYIWSLDYHLRGYEQKSDK